MFLKIRRAISPRLYREKSQGNWQYPFLAIGWRLAEFFTRSRPVSVDGVSLTIPCENWITHFRWYLFKTKETEVRHFIDTYLKPNETLFDVGANIGVFSVYAAKRGLRVFSFEPEYSNLALLKKNILRNRVHANIQTYCVGISDFVGLSKLHLQSTLGGAAAHTESTSAIQSTSEGFAVVFSEGIVTATLDYLCENLGVVPNGLKIDTDGNEPKILSGAPKLLKNPVLKSIIIEIPSDPDKKRFCEDILIQNGFHCDWSAQSSKNQIWVRIKNI